MDRQLNSIAALTLPKVASASGESHFVQLVSRSNTGDLGFGFMAVGLRVGTANVFSNRLYRGFKKFFLVAVCLNIAFQPMLVELARAQEIILDPNGNVGFAPQVHTGGSAPVVDISRPNTGGVSHNQYERFNVTGSGVVLNNSQAGYDSQLAGPIAGNPNLTGGTASTIVNEVTSTNGSTLSGSVEVAGDRATVIIANPNGITCNGCNFINASTGTLTTGVPVINGSTVRLDVTQGGITIGRGGLLGADTGTSKINLIGRTVVVDGKVTAIDGINVQGGAQSYDHTGGFRASSLTGVGATPDFVIDGTEYGAMEAGRIQIIGNETGVGVRSLGALQSNVGDIEVTSSGPTVLRSAYAQGDVDISVLGQASNTLVLERDFSSATGTLTVLSSGAITTTDRTGLYGATGVSVTSSNQVLSFSGVVQSGSDIDLSATNGSLSFLAYASATGTVRLKSASTIEVREATIVADQIEIDNRAQELRFSDAALFSRSDVVVQTVDLHLGQGVVVDGLTTSDTSNLVVTASGDFYNSADLRGHTSATFSYSGDFYNQLGGVLQEDQLQIVHDGEVHNDGVIFGDTSVQINVAALFNNATGAILSPDVDIHTTGLLQNTGTISSDGDIALSSDLKIENDGYIQGIRAYLTAPEIINSGNAELRVRDYAEITASTSFSNTGILASLASAKVVTGSFTTTGLVVVETDFYVLADDVLNRGSITAGNLIDVDATGLLENAGTIVSYNDINLHSDNRVENRGTLVADRFLSVTGPSFDNATAEARVRATGAALPSTIRNTGEIYLVDQFVFGDIDLFENTGVFASQGKIELTGRDSASQLVLIAGSVLIAGLQPDDPTQDLLASDVKLNFVSQVLNGKIAAGGSIDLVGPSQLVINGRLDAGDALVLTAGLITLTGDANATVVGAVQLNATTGFANHGTLTSNTFVGPSAALNAFENTDLFSVANLTGFTINGDFENSGLFLAGGDLAVTAAKITNDGHLQAEGDVTLTARRTQADGTFVAGNINHAGTLSSSTSGTIAFNGDVLTLAAGSYLTGGRLDLTGRRVVNAGNVALTGGTSTWTIEEDLQHSGTTFASGDLTVTADSVVSAAGSLLGSGNAVRLTAGTSLHVDGDVTGAQISVQAPALSSGTASSLFATDRLEITTPGHAALDGEIVGGNLLSLNSGSFDLRGPGYGADVLLVAQTSSYTRGTLSGVTSLRVQLASGQYHNTGTTQARDALNVVADSFLNEAGGVLSATDIDLSLAANGWNEGSILAASELSLTAGGNFTNQANARIEAVSFGLSAQKLVNAGDISAYGIFADVADVLENQGTIHSKTYFGLQSAAFVNGSGATLISDDHLYIKITGQLSNFDGSRIQGKSVDLRVGEFWNLGAILGTDLVNVADLTGSFYQHALGTIDGKTIALASGTSVSVSGRIGSVGGGPLPDTETIFVSAGTRAVNHGLIQANNVSISAAEIIVNHERISATGGLLTLRNTSQSVVNHGEISAKDAAVETTGNFYNRALFKATGSISVDVDGDLFNQSLQGVNAELEAAVIVLRAGRGISNEDGNKIIGHQTVGAEAIGISILNDGQILGGDITLVARNGVVRSSTAVNATGSFVIEARDVALLQRVTAADTISITATAYDIDVHDHVVAKRVLLSAARHVRSFGIALRGSELTQVIAGDILRFDGNTRLDGTGTRKLGVLGGPLKDVYVELTNGGFGTQNGYIHSYGSTIATTAHFYERYSLTASGSIALIASKDILLDGPITAGGDLYIRSNQDIALRWHTYKSGGTLHLETSDRLSNHRNAKLDAGQRLQLVQRNADLYTSEWLTAPVVTHSVTLSARNVVVDSSHYVSVGDLSLIATQDIIQTDQTLGAHSVIYSAGRDIKARFDPFNWRAANPNATLKGPSHPDQRGLQGYLISSRGSTSLYSGRDTVLQSGIVAAAGNLEIAAGGDFLSEPIYLESDRVGLQTVYDTYTSTAMCGHGEARAPCTDGSTITRTYPRTVAVENVPENVGWSFSNKYQGVQAGHLAQFVKIREMRAYENRLFAAHDVTIVAGASANFVGTRIGTAHKSISIQALNGGINMLAAPGYWTYNYTVHGSKKKFGVYKENFTLTFTELKDIYKPTTLSSANGNITLEATGTNQTYASIFSAGTVFNANNINIWTSNGNVSAGTYAERTITDTQYISSGSILGIASFGSQHVELTREIELNYGNDLYADNILQIQAPKGTLTITGGTLQARQINLSAARLRIQAAINSSRQRYYEQTDNMVTITTVEAGYDRETAALPQILGDVTFNVPHSSTLIDGYRGASLNTRLINVIGSKTFDNETLGLATPEALANAQQAAGANQRQFTYDYQLPGASDGAQFAYLDTLVQDYGATYHTIALRDHEWYDKKVQLNPAFQALLTVVVSAYVTPAILGTGATTGAGIVTNLPSSLAGTGLNAATTSLVVGVIDGSITGDLDIGDVLKDAILAGVAAEVAGFISSKVSGAVGGYSDQNPLVTIEDFSAPAILTRAGDRIINQVVSNVVYGEDPFEGFDDLGRTFLVTETLAFSQFNIGNLGKGDQKAWEGSIGHLLLHGGVGCLALEVLDGDCTAGFFAGASSSILAGTNLDDDQKLELSPVVGALAGYIFSSGNATNVSFGSTIAQSAIVNNYLALHEANRLDQCISEQDYACIVELGELSENRLDDLAACEGISSDHCSSVRNELRKVVANYFEAEESEGFEVLSSAEYFAHDALVRYGKYGYVEGDESLSTEGYTSARAIAVLTKTRDENEALLRFELGGRGAVQVAQEGGFTLAAFFPSSRIKELLGLTKPQSATGAPNRIPTPDRRIEIAELFDSSNPRNGIQIGDRTVLHDGSTGGARVFSGVSDTEIRNYFGELTGQAIPSSPTRVFSDGRKIYTVITPDGNFNLRNFSSSGTGRWTIDIPAPAGGGTKRELKFE